MLGRPFKDFSTSWFIWDQKFGCQRQPLHIPSQNNCISAWKEFCIYPRSRCVKWWGKKFSIKNGIFFSWKKFTSHFNILGTWRGRPYLSDKEWNLLWPLDKWSYHCTTHARNSSHILPGHIRGRFQHQPKICMKNQNPSTLFLPFNNATFQFFLDFRQFWCDRVPAQILPPHPWLSHEKA